MTKRITVTQESLITKFRNSDISDVYRLKKRSEQILWTLLRIKEFDIDEYIPASVLADVLVETLGISCTPKSVNNSLNPIKKKFHRKDVEGEIAYKIMQEGISFINKILEKKRGKISKTTFVQKKSVSDAIKKVKSMGKDKDLRPGLYYVVLIDLVGSSLASSKINPEENKKRIKQFINFTIDALPKKPKNFVTFVKDIGDASLFLFTNFEDILTWANKVDLLCNDYTTQCMNKKKPDVFHMYSKKCIHLGEVHFNDDSDPIALAINQISKIEKEFKKDQLGITDVVRQVISPRINSNQVTAKKLKNIMLPGDSIKRPLWVIGYKS